jgi:L-rhamnose-H+ transport protein
VIGVGAIAKAGKMREEDLAGNPASSRSSTRFMVGLMFCILSGALSALVNFSFIYGTDIANSAERSGAPAWAKGFAIWALVFTGNYLVNFLYAGFLMVRNRSFGQIAQGDARHWAWVIFMGIAWPAGIAIYGIAAFLLGDFGAYVGFPMMLVCSILFGNVAGALTGEWRGASASSKTWMAWGVAILILSLAVMGWSNHLLAG